MSILNTPVRLPDGNYQLPPFAILDEHEFTDEDTGRKQKFDRKRLQRLANKLNSRVASTGDMIPISDGHTVDGLPNKHQPDIVGVAHDFQVLPFYKTGRYAIFATPITDRDHVQTFKQKFRRSVELYVDKDGIDDDIDPISLLGSVSPKRDLGQPHRDLVLKLSRKSPDSLVRYLEPVSGKIHYQKTVEEPDMPMAPDDVGESKLSPEDIKAIVSELLQTEPLKKLLAMAEQMEGGEEPGAEGEGEGGPPPEVQDMPPQGPGPEDMPPEEPDREGMPKQNMAGPGMSSYAAPGPRKFARSVPEYSGDWREWLDQYEAMNNMPHEQAPPPPASEEVGRLRAELVQYKRDNAAKEKRLAALERESTGLKINEALSELAHDFDFDQEEEFSRLIKMSKQADRDAHYTLIRTRYSRRQDQVPGGGNYAITPSEEAPPPRRGGTRAPSTRYARSGEEASFIASEMVRRGIKDPEELMAILAKEQETNGKPVRTR